MPRLLIAILLGMTMVGESALHGVEPMPVATTIATDRCAEEGVSATQDQREADGQRRELPAHLHLCHHPHAGVFADVTLTPVIQSRSPGCARYDFRVHGEVPSRALRPPIA